jgi:hypothetical protein
MGERGWGGVSALRQERTLAGLLKPDSQVHRRIIGFYVPEESCSLEADFHVTSLSVDEGKLSLTPLRNMNCFVGRSNKSLPSRMLS